MTVLGIAPSEVREMTAGELMAAINAKTGKAKAKGIDYGELLDDLREAKNERSRHTIS